MCGSGPTELLNSNPIRARIHIHNAADDLEILPMKKLSRQKNILFPWTATASPATIDFCINLDRDFESLVVDKLCKTSRDAFLQQLDPASMPDTVRTKTRREITHTLYGNILYTYIEISVAEPDPVGSGTFFLDPELFVPDLDQARMKEQFKKIFIYNFKA